MATFKPSCIIVCVILCTSFISAKPFDRNRIVAQPEVEKTCEELLNEGLPMRVNRDHPDTDTCSAAKINGKFECSVASIGYDAAAATCASIGARLCKMEEINKDVSARLGCTDLNKEGSLCWLSDTTLNSTSCAAGSAYATRCKSMNPGLV